MTLDKLTIVLHCFFIAEECWTVFSCVRLYRRDSSFSLRFIHYTFGGERPFTFAINRTYWIKNKQSDTEQPDSHPNQSQRTSSPEYWSPTPVTHLLIHPANYISTHSTSLQCPVSLIHVGLLHLTSDYSKWSPERVNAFTYLLCLLQSVLLIFALHRVIVLLVLDLGTGVLPSPVR